MLFDAKILLNFSPEQPEGSRSAKLKSSLLLSAFAFEGYLNYLGRKLFPSWRDFERSLSWQSKTKLIADRIGFTLDEKMCPQFKTIKRLFVIFINYYPSMLYLAVFLNLSYFMSKIKN